MIDWIFLLYFYVVGIAIYATAIIIHEIGHWTYAKVKGRRPYISYEKKRLYTDYYGLTFTVTEHNKYILSGVMAGYLFIFICGIWFDYWFIIALLYSFGCIKDISRLDFK